MDGKKKKKERGLSCMKGNSPPTNKLREKKGGGKERGRTRFQGP